MRKMFKCLFVLVWIAAALVLESGTSAQSSGASAAGEEPICIAAAQGKSFDANTLTCVGSGDDCRGIAY